MYKTICKLTDVQIVFNTLGFVLCIVYFVSAKGISVTMFKIDLFSLLLFIHILCY